MSLNPVHGPGDLKTQPPKHVAATKHVDELQEAIGKVMNKGQREPTDADPK